MKTLVVIIFKEKNHQFFNLSANIKYNKNLIICLSYTCTNTCTHHTSRTYTFEHKVFGKNEKGPVTVMDYYDDYNSSNNNNFESPVAVQIRTVRRWEKVERKGVKHERATDCSCCDGRSSRNEKSFLLSDAAVVGERPMYI